jgi:hypothetical protein
MTEEANGFLGRWARRKNDALLGKPLAEPGLPGPLPAIAPVAVPVALKLPTPPVHGEVPVTVPEDQPLPALSLDDVRLLTKDSDFKPFMAQNVGPDVRNAAMKKLFEDPHFNIMDGLDIYIDDYSISEPIPESMLRQMASAKFLNLFEEEDEEDKKGEGDSQKGLPDAAALTAEPPDTADTHADQGVTQLPLTAPAQPTPDSVVAGIDPSSQAKVPSAFVASQENHADPYLRLQPDYAPSDPEAGRGS